MIHFDGTDYYTIADFAEYVHRHYINVLEYLRDKPYRKIEGSRNKRFYTREVIEEAKQEFDNRHSSKPDNTVVLKSPEQLQALVKAMKRRYNHFR